ncbi:hypothetical protein ACQUEF_01635 [Vagococcus fluvialis]|uniref:hypothetical protein n=1 Tax=Vagococcus fluvialis TaxID=2738 RepID=UPI003D1491C2
MSEETKYTDQTGLDKVDYDQEQVSPEVKKHVKNVRTKMFGRHVRESIARAIEFIDLTAQSALNFAKKAFSKSEDTENRLDNQIRDLTSDSEIIDLRYSKMLKKTFNILKDRGDFWDEEIKNHGLNVDWFGAQREDPTFDNSKAFQDAAEYALVNNLMLFAQGTYYTSNPIVFECDFDMKSAKIIYTGIGTCLTIGNKQKYARESGIAYVPEIINKSINWLTNEQIGLEIYNLNRWTINIKNIRYFKIGLRLTGSVLNGYVGTCYNNIYIQSIQNNKVNLEILATKTCWVNENLFIGGSYSHSDEFGYKLDDVRTIKIGLTSDSPYIPDNNTFLAPSLEGSIPDIPLEITGQNNVFMNARYESHEGYKYKVLFNGSLNPSVNNTLFYGYGLESIQIIEQGKTSRNVKITNSSQNLVSESPTAPMVTLQNLNNASTPVDRILSPYQKSKDEPAKYYSVERSANQTKMKNWDDEFDRIIITHHNGTISFGDGKKAPTNTMGPRPDGGIIMNSVGTISSTWENPPLKLGVYQFWVGTDGQLRMKEGKPTSSLDGHVVGR